MVFMLLSLLSSVYFFSTIVSLNSRGVLVESSSTNSASPSPSPTSSAFSFVSFAMEASTLFPVSSDKEFNDVNEKKKKNLLKIWYHYKMICK